MATPFFACSGRFFCRAANSVCIHNSALLAKNLRNPKFSCQQDKMMWKLLSRKRPKNMISPHPISQGISPKDSENTVKVSNTKKYKQSINEENKRMSMMGSNLRRHIFEIFSSGLVEIPELQDTQIDILKVKITRDYRYCFIYWKASGEEERDNQITDILNKYSNPIRSVLIEMHVLGRMPKLVFVKDEAMANAAIIDRLLAQIDTGEEDTEAGTEEYQTVAKSHGFARATKTVQPQAPAEEDGEDSDDEFSDDDNFDYQKLHGQLVVAKQKNKLWRELEQPLEGGEREVDTLSQFNKLQQVKRKTKKNKKDINLDNYYDNEEVNEETNFNIYNEDTDLEKDSDNE